MRFAKDRGWWRTTGHYGDNSHVFVDVPTTMLLVNGTVRPCSPVRSSSRLTPILALSIAI